MFDLGDPDHDGAAFDKDIGLDYTRLGPRITWGTNPAQVISIGDRIPDPAKAADADKCAAMQRALAYMGLEPNATLEGQRLG